MTFTARPDMTPVIPAAYDHSDSLAGLTGIHFLPTTMMSSRPFQGKRRLGHEVRALTPHKEINKTD